MNEIPKLKRIIRNLEASNEAFRSNDKEFTEIIKSVIDEWSKMGGMWWQAAMTLKHRLDPEGEIFVGI